MRKLSLKKIKTMKILHQGHSDDLLFEDKNTRVWLSRMTKEDGQPYNNQITEENYILQSKYTKGGIKQGIDTNKGKTWQTIRQYEAK